MVIDSYKFERDLCEKPVPTFSHPALGSGMLEATLPGYAAFGPFSKG